MNKQTFSKIEGIAWDALSIASTRVVSMSDTTKLFPILEAAMGDKNKEKTEKKEKPLCSVSAYMEQSEIDHFMRKEDSFIENYITKAMHGKRPPFWPSWAHLPQGTTDVVEEHDIAVYCQHQLTRAYKQMLAGIKYLPTNTEQKIFRSSNYKVLQINKNLGNLGNRSFFKYMTTNNSITDFLVSIWMAKGLNITKDTETGYNIYIKDNDISTSDSVMELFTDWLGSALNKSTAPAFKGTMFDFYMVDLYTLALFIAFMRFPVSLNLNNSVAFLEKVVGDIMANWGIEDILVKENPICFFVHPKTRIAKGLFDVGKYMSIEYPRHDPNILDSDLLKNYRAEMPTKKLTNKEFFDYERLLGITIDHTKKQDLEYVHERLRNARNYL